MLDSARSCGSGNWTWSEDDIEERVLLGAERGKDSSCSESKATWGQYI